MKWKVILVACLMLVFTKSVFGVTSVGTNIVTGGNIGIGTTNPVQKLEVVGSIKMVDGNQASGKYMASDANGLASWAAAPAGVPTGFIGFFNLASCPTGWTDKSSLYGGRYLVAKPTSGTLAATVGTALTDSENRAVGQHSHSLSLTDNGHTHTYSGTSASDGVHSHSISDPGHKHPVYYWTSGGCGYSNWYPQSVNYDCESYTTNTGVTTTTGVTVASGGAHTHSYSGTSASGTTGISGSATNTGSVAGTNAPYAQFLLCQKD